MLFASPPSRSVTTFPQMQVHARIPRKWHCRVLLMNLIVLKAPLGFSLTATSPSSPRPSAPRPPPASPMNSPKRKNRRPQRLRLHLRPEALRRGKRRQPQGPPKLHPRRSHRPTFHRPDFLRRLAHLHHLNPSSTPLQRACRARRRYRYRRPPNPPDAIPEIDRRKWNSKGIASAIYEGAG